MAADARAGAIQRTIPVLFVALGPVFGCTVSQPPPDESSDQPVLEAADTTQRPEDTEVWEPEPAVVVPGQAGSPPADATVLFDGSGLDAWTGTDGGEARWDVQEGALTVRRGAGDIRTRQAFGDVQLHIEWRTPALYPARVRAAATAASISWTATSCRCSIHTRTAPTRTGRPAPSTSSTSRS